MANTSIYWDILQAVHRRLITLAPDRLSPAQIHIRKRPAFIREHDSLPLLLVCPEAEREDEHQFGATLFVDYPVIVALLDESALVLADPSWQLARRQEIRRRLHQVLLSDASTVFDVVSYEPSPLFDLGGLDAAFDVSLQRFVYRSHEQREES